MENIDMDMSDSVVFQVMYVGQIPHKKQREVLRCPKKNKVIVCGRRCIEENEYVYTDMGIKKCGEIVDGDSVIGGVVDDVHSFDDDVYEVTFANGLKIKTNLEHPFWATSHPDSKPTWKPLSMVKDMFRSYVFFENPKNINEQCYDKDFAKLLGYLTSDGYWADGQSLKFTNTNMDLLNEVKMLGEKFGFKTRMVKKGNGFDLFLLEYKYGGRNKDKEMAWRKTFRDLGIYDKSSFGKIQSFDEEALVEFVKGQFNGDGCLWVKDREGRTPRMEINFSVGICERKAIEMQYMLWRLGIFSRIKHEIGNKAIKGNWKVIVSAREDVKKLLFKLDDVKYPEKFKMAIKMFEKVPKIKHYYEEDDGRWIKVRSVKYVGKRKVVGWETVGNNEIMSYCGMKTHNSGKSQLVAGVLIEGAVKREYKRQLLVAPTYKQSMIVMNKIVDLMWKSGNGDDMIRIVKSPNPKIVFRGSEGGDVIEIDFGSADNPDSLRGENYDRLFLDEGEFIKEDAMNAIRPLIYDTGAPMWITTTPWKRNFVYEFWCRGEKGDKDWGSYNYCYLDNPYITDSGKEEIEKDIEEWGESSIFVQAEIYGRYVDGIDCYFSSEVIEASVDDDIVDIGKGGVVRHPKYRYVLGCDIAGEGEDESVFLVIQIGYDNVIKIVDIRYYEKNLPHEIVGMVRELDDIYRFEMMYFDKTGMGDGPTDWVAEELGRDRVEGIRFNTKIKMDMYSNCRKMMQMNIKRFAVEDSDEDFCGYKLKIPRYKKLVWELGEMRFERKANGLVSIHHPVGPKYHDDYCFVAGSKVLTDNGNVNIEDLCIGDMVMTRLGYKKILATGNRVENVISRFGITGTADHPFITTSGIKKFISVDVSDKLYIWNEKQSFIEERAIIDIQSQKEDIYEYIIGDIQIGKNPLNHCIEIFGKMKTVKFLKDILFTTKMEIHSITKLKILKLCHEENINLNICIPKSENNNQEKILKSMQDLKLLNGISQKQEENGTVNMEKILGRIESIMIKNVNVAEKNIKQDIREYQEAVVPYVLEEYIEKKSKIKNKKLVYNITVEDCNEYFVNNILVHNCDSLVLACWHLKGGDSEYKGIML